VYYGNGELPNPAAIGKALRRIRCEKRVPLCRFNVAQQQFYIYRSIIADIAEKAGVYETRGLEGRVAFARSVRANVSRREWRGNTRGLPGGTPRSPVSGTKGRKCAQII
jgi:hypothetical protein